MSTAYGIPAIMNRQHGPYVALDIEVTAVLEDFSDWRMARPLGISCAATYTSDTVLRLWHGAPGTADAPYPERMAPDEVRQLIDYLLEKEREGYTVTTWNGLGFDFDVLAEEAADPAYHRAVAELAVRHVDPFFNMVCDKGYGISLNTAAKGLHLQGKTEGMSGALAPVMWREGREAQDKVLEYVGQDAVVTANVYGVLRKTGTLSWVTKRGKIAHWFRPVGIVAPVNLANTWPEPDTAWMDRPQARSSFYAWTGIAL